VKDESHLIYDVSRFWCDSTSRLHKQYIVHAHNCPPEPSPYSSLLYHRLVSMSFVKLSIFGTSFEVRSHLPCLSLQPSHSPIPGYHKICRSPTRRHGSVIPLILHPACPPLTSFKGAFGLVWYASLHTFLVPTTPTHVPCSVRQKTNSQAHPSPSRRS
jgi:hypothetical protein